MSRALIDHSIEYIRLDDVHRCGTLRVEINHSKYYLSSRRKKADALNRIHLNVFEYFSKKSYRNIVLSKRVTLNGLHYNDQIKKGF